MARLVGLTVFVSVRSRVEPTGETRLAVLLVRTISLVVVATETVLVIRRGTAEV